MVTYCGPHHSSSGKRLASRNRTITRSVGDQPPGAPNTVSDQSSERIRSPISPPPSRKDRSSLLFVAAITALIPTARKAVRDDIPLIVHAYYSRSSRYLWCAAIAAPRRRRYVAMQRAPPEAYTLGRTRRCFMTTHLRVATAIATALVLTACAATPNVKPDTTSAAIAQNPACLTE